MALKRVATMQRKQSGDVTLVPTETSRESRVAALSGWPDENALIGADATKVPVANIQDTRVR